MHPIVWKSALFLLFALPLAPPRTEVLAAGNQPNSCFALPSQTVCITAATYTADVCTAIAGFANHFGIPQGFFARLIWQESRFDPQAISSAGAQGIAQFMPSTADLRSLSNPFDPAEALARSAEYLGFLQKKFGNLGLAAAAYNGGEARITRYLTGGGVPAETRAFVSIITGQPIEYWLGDAEPVDFTLKDGVPFDQACIQMAKAVPVPTFGPQSGQWQPWGVLIAQNFSADIARGAFVRAQAQFPALLGDKHLLLVTIRNLSLGTRQRFSAQVGFAGRDEAEKFCRQLKAAGGNCIVQRNQG